MRGFLAALLCSAAFAADEAARLERLAAKTPPALAIEFRLLGAKALEARHPEESRRFVEAALDQMRAAKDGEIREPVIRALAAAAPEDLAKVLPQISPRLVPSAITALAQAGNTVAALRLYRDARSKGEAQPADAGQLLAYLARAKSPEAAKLFDEIAANYHFENMTPNQAWSAVGTAQTAAAVAPEAAAGVFERVIQMASRDGYGEDVQTSLEGEFQLGSKTVHTSTSRDTLLLTAGSYLHAVSPGRAAKYRELLSRWDVAAPMRIRSSGVARRGGQQARADAAIYANLTKFRGLPTDADRARLAIETAAAVRRLPADVKLNAAINLAGRSTEGDLGKEALTAVAAALGEGLRGDNRPGVSEYLVLAALMRYERIPPPIEDPALDAAAALLALRDNLVAEGGFDLEGLDGKKYSLASLKGKVVLLNFWATWCPPCRKEMPDMERLSREFAKKGLVVLAVSDEDRDVVLGYLAKESYSFPFLLDPERKVQIAFHVDSIPKSFVFDRTGNLAAQGIDMRTEAQFRVMLRQAGLE